MVLEKLVTGPSHLKAAVQVQGLLHIVHKAAGNRPGVITGKALIRLWC
jgi:hypothetical protein